MITSELDKFYREQDNDYLLDTIVKLHQFEQKIFLDALERRMPTDKAFQLILGTQSRIHHIIEIMIER